MAEKREATSRTLVLGRYRIVEQLARGGMGVVYLARTEGAQGFTRPVIVKRIIPHLAEDEATARLFVREARILANLQHPGIVNVIDFDEEDGTYVMVLEYVHGYTLAQWHKYVVSARKEMPIDYAIFIMTRVLDALHYAHTFVRSDGTPMQIVHRDVSPANILIDTQAHVKLLDFGIARADGAGEYKTHDSAFKGKLTYAAPEVYDGSEATPESDVYSAGVVLYQLLLGENPFKGKDTTEIVRRVLTEKLPPISSRRSGVSQGLDDALERALAKDPLERFSTASAFADALRAVRSRREEDFQNALVEDVWNDFNGAMPEALGLEPLSARDAAWRAAAGDARSSIPVELHSMAPATSEAATKTQRQSPTVPVPKETPSAVVDAKPAAPSAPTSRMPLYVGFVAVLAAGAGLYAWSAGHRAEAPASRFVVVEKQARDDVPAVTGTTSPMPDPPPMETAAPASVPSAALSALAAKAALPVTANTAPQTAAKPDPAALSRTVQRRRGEIEGCFLRHVKELDGRPEVSVRFRVATSGHVDGADLTPGALGGTPLGQCLLGIAKGTEFGPLSEPVTFAIPISARRVK